MSGVNGLLEGVKAVIFDFDGVILESGHIKTEAFLALFADYPQHREAISRHHLENLGVSRFDKFEWIYGHLLGRPLGEEERAALGERFAAIVLEKVLECGFVPGAAEALAALHGRYGLFVASGTPQEELELIVAQRGLRGYFDGVWGAPRRKPEIIEAILVERGLRPEEALFVGDGTSDYEAAAATGTRFVARLTPEMAGRWEGLGVAWVEDLGAFGAGAAGKPGGR